MHINCKNTILYTLIMALCLESYLKPTVAQQDTLPQQQVMNKVPLKLYLVQMGTALDCYFTIETKRGNDRKSPLLSDVFISQDANISNIKALIMELQRDLPEMSVLQSSENPAVIHIIDKSLKTSDGYGLAQKVKITYSGLLLELPNALGRQLNDSIVAKNPSIINQMYEDVVTSVNIKPNLLLTRDALTDFVPLSVYSRILWVAATRQEQGKWQTWVHYPGTGIPNVPLKSEPLPIAFSQGQIAYAKNPNSPTIADSAISFITTQMQKGEPLQVRWAMFYLGKYKVEKGLPVLLKYLDYQYTTVPLLDEAYPALHALVDMGQPAATAAQGSLVTETNALRLELLCRVIIGVGGQAAGQNSIEAALNTIKDAAQQARVKAALTKVLTEPVATARVPTAATTPSNAAL